MSIGNLENLQTLSRRSKGAKEVLVLNCEDVVPKASQVREKFSGIEELAASIKVNGQEQPIIVHPKGNDGKYRIQKGERRWRACKLAGMKIEVIVNKKELDELDETAGELIENIQRENLTPIEIARGFQKFIDAGWKAVDVSKRLGKSRGYVSQHLALLKLPECVMALYDEDITSDPETLNILRQIYDIAPAQAEILCRKALDEGISRKAARQLHKQAKASTLPDDPNPNLVSETTSSISAADSFPSTSPTVEGSENDALTHADISKGNRKKGREVPSHQTEPNTSQPAKLRQVARSNVEDTSKKWLEAEPSAARIVVSLEEDGARRTGILLLDRVDLEPGYCWIRLADDNEDTLVRVMVSEVQLVGVEGGV